MDPVIIEKGVYKMNASNWIWTVVRGAIALALGLFLIFGNDTARLAVAYVTSAYLALAGGFQTFSGFLNRSAPGSTTDRLRGVVGLVAGLILLLLLFLGTVELSTLYFIIAIAVIVFGVLGLFESFFDRGGKYFTWMPVIVNVLLVVLGLLLFYSRSNLDFDLKLWTGVILTLIGLGIIAYSYVVQKPKPDVLASNV